MEKYIELSERNSAEAERIIAESRIEDIWRGTGCRINRVGSLRMGVMSKHPDIDFHIYSAPLTVARSFSAIERLAENPHIRRIYYTNLIDTDEHCIEWHAVWEQNGQEWTIDMIHILSGSLYDGHFERMADAVTAALTPEKRETILRLKYETPEGEHIMGVEYYRAVLDFGVDTYADFTAWRAVHAGDDLMNWLPR